MDPWAPINGLTLERYAELCAAIDGVTDPEQHAVIVQQQGVARHDWEAAKAGWTQRMADPSLMGQVATRFSSLYQGALARKRGYAQPPYPPQPQYPQAQSAGAEIGSALNAFGSAFNSLVETAIGGMSVGARVLVQWSDGNKYPATVTASNGAQLEVAFPDGRRLWVPQAYVSIAGL